MLQRELTTTGRSFYGVDVRISGDNPNGDPLSQALGAVLDQGVLDRTLAARCGGALLSILPEAAHIAPELVAPAGADPETIAFGVARATTRLLRQICLQRRCVLVIEDVHDADRDECAFVEPLLATRTHRFVSGGPMFMYVGDPVERYLGLVVAQLGDRPRAITHLESALARVRAVKGFPFIARIALDLAGLLESGSAAERERARALTREARELAEQFDLTHLRSRDATTRSSSAGDSDAPYVPVSPGFRLVREGDTWAISSRGRSATGRAKEQCSQKARPTRSL